MDSGYNHGGNFVMTRGPVPLHFSRRFRHQRLLRSAYFSLDGGQNALDEFNSTQNASNGAEFSDWDPDFENGYQIEDAGGDHAALTNLSFGSEFLMLDVLGWTPPARRFPR